MRLRRLPGPAPKRSRMRFNLSTSKSLSEGATSKLPAIPVRTACGSGRVKSPTTTTAKRRFGQHFLVDHRVVDRIVSAVAPRSDETIVEIGSGQGAVTGRLLETTGRVVAIEFDREIVPFLRAKFAGVANLHLIEADALTTDFRAAIGPARS